MKDQGQVNTAHGPDIELARSWRGGPAVPAQTAAGVQAIEDRLGLIRLLAIAGLVHGLRIESVDDHPRVADFPAL